MQRIGISRSVFGVAAVCAVAMSGCAAPMIPSQRLHQAELSSVTSGPIQIGGYRFAEEQSPECTSCEDRQRLHDYAHHAVPYVAGPFMHRGDETVYAAEQATIQPPHSKFHPVPTRPVFEARASYQPPQAMGVHLVPVPDQAPQPMMPGWHEPNSPLGYPRELQRETPEALDASGNEPDTFMLPPPQN